MLRKVRYPTDLSVSSNDVPARLKDHEDSRAAGTNSAVRRIPE
jgi:hypothetical protein